MSIIKFLFLLGVCFAIFEFLWVIAKFIFNTLTSSFNSPVKSKIIRIVKYIIFTTVIIEFIQIINTKFELINSNYTLLILGNITLALYLIGKYQNRSMFSQFKGITKQFSSGFSTLFDTNLERLLILVSLIVFSIGIFYPLLFSNPISSWFSQSIINIYQSFFIGFIFKIIAFFLIISTFNRGGKIIGKLVSGQSFKEASESNNNMSQFFNNQGFSSRFKQTKQEEPEFTDYEDVTEDINDKLVD